MGIGRTLRQRDHPRRCTAFLEPRHGGTGERLDDGELIALELRSDGDPGLPDENPASSTFYDIAHPVRRDLHRRYIRHCLDVLKDNTNVVYGIDREYSGPLPFVQFVLDTIAEWERERGRKVFVCLEVPKAVMDAILNDPKRRPHVTAVDFHHWFYRPAGWAALRDSRRDQRGAARSRKRFRARDDAPRRAGAQSSDYGLGDGGAGLVYSMEGEAVELDLTNDRGAVAVAWLDGASGELKPTTTGVSAGKLVTLTPPAGAEKRPWVAWLTRG